MIIMGCPKFFVQSCFELFAPYEGTCICKAKMPECTVSRNGHHGKDMMTAMNPSLTSSSSTIRSDEMTIDDDDDEDGDQSTTILITIRNAAECLESNNLKLRH